MNIECKGCGLKEEATFIAHQGYMKWYWCKSCGTLMEFHNMEDKTVPPVNVIRPGLLRAEMVRISLKDRS